MKLNPVPFSLISNETKTIELRLWDEKRKQVSVGDTLIFSSTADSKAQLICTVVKLHIFPNFAELYAALPLDRCGYLPQELSTANAQDMNQYYSIEEQRKYGVVGIEIKLTHRNDEPTECQH